MFGRWLSRIGGLRGAGRRTNVALLLVLGCAALTGGLAFAAGTSAGDVATRPGSPGYDHSFALAGEPTKSSKDKQTISARKKFSPLACCHFVTRPFCRLG